MRFEKLKCEKLEYTKDTGITNIYKETIKTTSTLLCNCFTCKEYVKDGKICNKIDLFANIIEDEQDRM